jgi:hypothetical protein
VQSPQEAVSAGAICYRRAEKELLDWGNAWAEYVDAKLAYQNEYTKAYDKKRSTGEAVKSCELHAQVECADLEREMLLAEGSYKIHKAAYELNKDGMSLAQSSMRTLSAEMDMAR